jgi:hypothetical protein
MRKFLLIVTAFLAFSGVAFADVGPGPNGPIPRVASK